MRIVPAAVLLVAVSALFASARMQAPPGTLATNNSPKTYRALEKEVLDASAALYKRWTAVRDLPRRKRAKAMEDYQAAAGRFADEWGEKGIEVLVRVDEEHLSPVMMRLASKGEWFSRIRALFWLYERRERSALPVFLDALDDEVPLVREIAAVGIAAVADPASYKKKIAPRVAERLERETDAFVKNALAASHSLLLKRKSPVEIYEVFSAGAPGRRIRPYINGYRKPKGYVEKRWSRSGRAGKLKPAEKWGWPVSGFRTKIIAGLSSVPFGGLKTPTVYHLGEDVGWFEDGSGFYAIADGVVRFVQHGGDWGGLIVVEHRLSKDEYCCALYGHAGRFLFARPGDEVKCGQLLGMMGLSFSLENGGHGAHCHFGIFRGRFDPARCVGYRSKDKGLADFYDPTEFLEKRTAPEYGGEQR